MRSTLGMYPLGSCTMKYNGRVNEAVARLEGIAEAHPYQPTSLSQGCLQIMATLEDALIEITGHGMRLRCSRQLVRMASSPAS